MCVCVCVCVCVQVLMEDRRTNRLVESMNIFETIVNNKLFLHVSIILFLNKTDLLVDKIRTADIRKTFPEFRGDPRRLEDVQVLHTHTHTYTHTHTHKVHIDTHAHTLINPHGHT